METLYSLLTNRECPAIETNLVEPRHNKPQYKTFLWNTAHFLKFSSTFFYSRVNSPDVKNLSDAQPSVRCICQ